MFRTPEELRALALKKANEMMQDFVSNLPPMTPEQTASFKVIEPGLRDAWADGFVDGVMYMMEEQRTLMEKWRKISDLPK